MEQVLDLPSCFPKELAPRALEVYAFLRTFSRLLHLSPFKVISPWGSIDNGMLWVLPVCSLPSSTVLLCTTHCSEVGVNVRTHTHGIVPRLRLQTTGFLTALALKIPSLLLDECHFALLRVLEPVSARLDLGWPILGAHATRLCSSIIASRTHETRSGF